MGIYERKKRVRKQENMHSFKKKKELAQENTLSTKKASKRTTKQKSFFLFSLGRYLGREHVFLSKFFFSWASLCLLEPLLSCFLTFFSINSQPCILHLTISFIGPRIWNQFIFLNVSKVRNIENETPLCPLSQWLY